jgi:hypothetical protein
LAALTAFFAFQNARQPTDDELARRIASCAFTWQNYQEDIKTISSALAAQWRGAPNLVVRDRAQVHVTFLIEGPWADRNVAIPVLLREERGGVYQSGAAECDSGSAVYTFELSGWDATAPLPWIELQYPHGRRRIVLSPSGRWRAEETLEGGFRQVGLP